ncbi:MAG: PTS sugar transporter subunit IIA [Pseudomonadota bacterium]
MVRQMGLQGLLGISDVFENVHARCKRDLISILADKASQKTGITASDIEAALIDRERLGSTGIGSGVAIPHGKIENLPDVTAILVRLDTPIDFDAIDGEPIDLAVLLLAPENATAAHLKALAKVTRLLRDSSVREALRGAETAEAIFAITQQDQHSNAA